MKSLGISEETDLKTKQTPTTKEKPLQGLLPYSEFKKEENIQNFKKQGRNKAPYVTRRLKDVWL